MLIGTIGNLQVNILVSLILDLFMEVEALRGMIKIDSSLLNRQPMRLCPDHPSH